MIDLQIAAFAEHLFAFPDEISFRSAANPFAKLATRAFIPSGLFKPNGDQIEPPQAQAIFTGQVLSCESRINPFTNCTFVYLIVATLAGSIDVVASPKVVRGEIRVGGFVAGSFWLSGRLV